MTRRWIAGIGLTGALVLPLMATEVPQTASAEGMALKGTLMSRLGEDGAWVETAVDETSHGQWFQTDANSVGVVSYGDGMRLRLSPNTLVRVRSATQVDLRRGKVLARIEPGAGRLSVRSKSGEVLSNGGTFVCTADDKDMALNVVTGRAALKSDKVVAPQLPKSFAANGVELFPGLIAYTPGFDGPEADVAMDGPDTQRRPPQVRNEQLPPQNAGETLPPSPAPETETPTPAVEETPFETPTAAPPPPPPDNPPPPIVEEGTDLGPIIAGGAVTAGIIAFLLSQQDGEEQNQFVLIPGSP